VGNDRRVFQCVRLVIMQIMCNSSRLYVMRWQQFFEIQDGGDREIYHHHHHQHHLGL